MENWISVVEIINRDIYEIQSFSENNQKFKENCRELLLNSTVNNSEMCIPLIELINSYGIQVSFNPNYHQEDDYNLENRHCFTSRLRKALCTKDEIEIRHNEIIGNTNSQRSFFYEEFDYIEELTQFIRHLFIDESLTYAEILENIQINLQFTNPHGLQPTIGGLAKFIKANSELKYLAELNRRKLISQSNLASINLPYETIQTIDALYIEGNPKISQVAKDFNLDYQYLHSIMTRRKDIFPLYTEKAAEQRQIRETFIEIFEQLFSENNYIKDHVDLAIYKASRNGLSGHQISAIIEAILVRNEINVQDFTRSKVNTIIRRIERSNIEEA